MSNGAAGDRRIAVQPNGPYFVSGDVDVLRRSPVVSEHGEPMTWETTERFPARERVALCRCGQSSKKPFCDGTHAIVGFDGTNAEHTSTYEQRQRTYEGTRVVVRDDRSICTHAGFCGNRVTNIWKMATPAGTEDSIARAQLMAMIERCPSGALTYRLEPDSPDIEPELAPEVGVVDDGPLWVTGRIPVGLPDGTTLEARNRVTLCRCGQSSNKPLCDGSHKEVGFHDAAPELI
jgi:CDGSH-type Zn-finger protein